MEKSSECKSPRKHSAVDVLDGIQVIVLDIEGTTTPITFVKDVLFGYVKENLENYLKNNWDEEECKRDVELLRQQAELDCDIDGVVSIPAADDDNPASAQKAVTDSIRWLMSSDRKVTALKQLQGHMWRSGYENKQYYGEIYGDVLPAIRMWISQDMRVYVYSSGSVEAQKLLFGHTEHGSLLHLFSGYFDTTVGPKINKDSYRKISEEVGCEPSQILFLTDVTREARPAEEAGYRTVIVVREGNAPLTPEEERDFNLIRTFRELTSDEPAKKMMKC